MKGKWKFILEYEPDPKLTGRGGPFWLSLRFAGSRLDGTDDSEFGVSFMTGDGRWIDRQYEQAWVALYNLAKSEGYLP